MSIEERLERLERELLASKRRTHWLLAAVGVVVVGVGLTWVLANTTTTAQAQGPKVIRANQFVLDDERGRPRVWLFVDKNGPRMTMLDEGGKSIWSAP